MIIGAPGSGKTTALVNSGLSFPLAKDMGKGPIAGVGGTRSCDWWFAEEAVLIDTAGRFTTQDSDREADAAAWTGFLRLLKHHRGRKALNGVILAFSVTDLLTLDDAALGRTTKAVRDRLGELRQLVMMMLKTRAVDQIAFYSEAYGICGSSEVAEFSSIGHADHVFCALVPGERQEWLSFASELEFCLTTANFPYSIVVQTETVNANTAQRR